VIDDLDTSLVTILTQMGLLPAEDRDLIEYTVASQEGESLLAHDARVAAYLLNNDCLTEQHLKLAEQFQQKLRSPNLMEQTKAMAAITKMRSTVLCKQLQNNTRLADALIKSTTETSKKSTTSENVAVGFLVAAKASRR